MPQMNRRSNISIESGINSFPEPLDSQPSNNSYHHYIADEDESSSEDKLFLRLINIVIQAPLRN
ncbi:9319_t:CDS:1, partial [Racocetra fulgida]